MTIAEELKKYKDIITGIIIDRGAGDEYFDVTNIGENSQGEIFLSLDDGDLADVKWLETCNIVKLVLKEQITIKEDTLYGITARKSELEQIVHLLMDVYDILCEVPEEPSNTNSTELLKRVWELKKKIQSIVVK